jgi:hypothetical protein
MKVVTDSSKDWFDFWFNSDDFDPSKITCNVDDKEIDCNSLKEQFKDQDLSFGGTD